MSARAKKPAAWIEVWKDPAGGWRWRLKRKNGRKVATAGEAFASASNARRAARAVMRPLGLDLEIRVVAR